MTIAEAVAYPFGMGAASTISFLQVGSLQCPDAGQPSLGRCKVSLLRKTLHRRHLRHIALTKSML